MPAAEAFEGLEGEFHSYISSESDISLPLTFMSPLRFRMARYVPKVPEFEEKPVLSPKSSRVMESGWHSAITRSILAGPPLRIPIHNKAGRLKWTRRDGRLRVTVPRLDIHGVVVVD